MIRGAIQAWTTVGFRRAARTLLKEWRVCRRHRASVSRLRHNPVASPLRLNIGCGRKLKAGWVNVDLIEEADLQLDLREPLPFPDASVAIVYSEHFFEHLEYPDDALAFLREIHRALAPGGVVSLGVPDTEWPLVAYATGDDEYFRLAREGWHPAWCDTRMHHINYHFRQGQEHKYAYDFETLSAVLAHVGFVDVKRRTFNPELDTESRSAGTLYVDARKPERA